MVQAQWRGEAEGPGKHWSGRVCVVSGEVSVSVIDKAKKMMTLDPLTGPQS